MQNLLCMKDVPVNVKKNRKGIGRLLIACFLLSISMFSCVENIVGGVAEELESISYDYPLSDGDYWFDAEKGCKAYFKEGKYIGTLELTNIRFILLSGSHVMYKPGVKSEDLYEFAAKEIILNLAKISMRSDPSLTNSSQIEFKNKKCIFSDIDACMYYLIIGDEKVDPDIKKAAKAHYNSAIEQFVSQQMDNLYVEDSSPGTYEFVFYPSQLNEEIRVELGYATEGKRKGCLYVRTRFRMMRNGIWY